MTAAGERQQILVQLVEAGRTGVCSTRQRCYINTLTTAEDAEEPRNLFRMQNDAITERIIAAALKVHTALGAGCLESTYHVKLDAGYRIDFLIENCVVVELKSVEKLLPLRLAQVMTYLKLSGHHVGLLINFNVPHLRHGIKRVVNNYREDR
jgi:hypothetical protein